MKVYPHLWFNGRAEEAMEFYVSVFDGSRAPERSKLRDPVLSVVRFALPGRPVAALNANSSAPYNEAFSFLVETGDQEETDYLGRAHRCRRQ